MKRNDLPAVAFTITPSGSVQPLFCGRGVGVVLQAEVKPGGPDHSFTHVLELKLGLRSGEPVPWETLADITNQELADGTYSTLMKG